MIAPSCRHDQTKRHGYDRKGNQRFRCVLCGKTWLEPRVKPIGDMRIKSDKAVLCLRLLLEGNSIRSTERITGVNRNTILTLLETVGRRALRFWELRMKRLPAANVEVDEIWGFVGCKEKTRLRLGYGEETGEAYTFTAIERDTKLLIAWHTGKRLPADAIVFSGKLQEATASRCQVTTDGFVGYATGVPQAFHYEVDFAQLVKIYGKQPERSAAARYSPAQITEIHKHIICGRPDEDLICTSHVERQNLNIRMAVRRMTRLTNAFSKKWQNHDYHLALYFLYYNFCRVHTTLKSTPAVAARIADQQWTVSRLLEELATLD